MDMPIRAETVVQRTEVEKGNLLAGSLKQHRKSGETLKEKTAGVS